MGNCCIGHKSSIVCAGDDDYYYGFESVEPNTEESLRLLGSEINRPCSSSSSSGCGREVKIKMTKKQLEELLTGVDVQGKPVDQLLKSLINNHHHDDRDHHPFETTTTIQEEFQGPWTPTLQRIPEAD